MQLPPKSLGGVERVNESAVGSLVADQAAILEHHNVDPIASRRDPMDLDQDLIAQESGRRERHTSDEAEPSGAASDGLPQVGALNVREGHVTNSMLRFQRYKETRRLRQGSQ